MSTISDEVIESRLAFFGDSKWPETYSPTNIKGWVESYENAIRNRGGYAALDDGDKVRFAHLLTWLHQGLRVADGSGRLWICDDCDCVAGRDGLVGLLRVGCALRPR